MSSFEEISRPVIIEYNHAKFNYWGKGSSFLIATSKNYYWVTAAHVLANIGGDPKSLRIFPSDNSIISLPFNEQYTINKGLTDDDDHKDIFMLRIDLTDFDSSGDAPLIAQDIEQGILPAEQLEPDDELWVIGYPSESNFIDYDNREIKNTRSVLRAIYQGRSISDHCHKLIIDSSIKLESYDGLSGCPVFHMKQLNSNEQAKTLLVGMLLRGTALSGIVHFVSSSVIVNIINSTENSA